MALDRCADRRRPAPTDRSAASRARGRSPRPTTRDRPPAPSPRSGDARWGARHDRTPTPLTLSCATPTRPSVTSGRAPCTPARRRCGYPDRRRQSLRSLAVADTTPTPQHRLRHAWAQKLPADLVLTPLVGRRCRHPPCPIVEWLTTFHLASGRPRPVHQRELLGAEATARVLEQFRGSDTRINLVVTANAVDARAFLGPYAADFLRVLRPRPRLREGHWV